MDRRSNIVFLHVDQLKWSAVGANGCKEVHTPNMDRLLKESVCFDRAYVTVPQCVPSRTSWYTGLEPEQSGITKNARQIEHPQGVADLGGWLRDKGGYDSYYMGKWHIALPHPGGFTRLYGSNHIGEYGDTAVARAAEEFLLNHQGDQPFFLNVGLLNPHDICYWNFPYSPGKFSMAREMEERLPPLPPNFNRANVEKGWTDLEWRFYAYSYFRFVEMVDEEIGRIYRAFLRSPQHGHTIFVFASDHGQASGEHGLLTKGSPYEHSLRVPFAVVDPQASHPRRDANHLVGGLDVAPTICDYAGVDPMPRNNGTSLKPLVRGENPGWRDWLAASTPQLRHRIILKGNHKLVFNRQSGAAQFFDLETDPWEMSDLSNNPAHALIRKDLLALRERHDAGRELAPVAEQDLRRWSWATDR